MKNQLISATIPCDSCSGLICLPEDQFTEGQIQNCPHCGHKFSFSKENLEGMHSDLALIEKVFEEVKRKR